MELHSFLGVIPFLHSPLQTDNFATLALLLIVSSERLRRRSRRFINIPRRAELALNYRELFLLKMASKIQDTPRRFSSDRPSAPPSCSHCCINSFSSSSDSVYASLYPDALPHGGFAHVQFRGIRPPPKKDVLCDYVLECENRSWTFLVADHLVVVVIKSPKNSNHTVVSCFFCARDPPPITGQRSPPQKSHAHHPPPSEPAISPTWVSGLPTQITLPPSATI